MKAATINEVGLDESIAIKLSDLSLGDPIGSGGFGEVLIGTWTHTRVHKTTVAIKRLLAKELSANVLGEFKNEVAVHVELEHPNIVKLFGITIVQPYCMVMEFMSNGSLCSYLEKTPQTDVTWDRRLTIAEGTIAGMVYLHGLTPPIIHGDFKSLNVLLDENYTAKIADFGLSQLRLETSSKAISNTSGQNGKGSLLWMAPELFGRRAKKTLQSDIYALGWTLWELAAHKCPFYEEHDKSSDVIMSFIKQGERENFPDGTPLVYQVLIEACWDGAIAKRPTAVAALEAITVLIKPKPIANTNVRACAVAPKLSDYLLNSSSSPVLTKSAPKAAAQIAPPRQNSSSSSPSYLIESVSNQSPKVSSWIKGAVKSKPSTAVKPTAPPLTGSYEKDSKLRSESLTMSVPTQLKLGKPSDLGKRYQKFHFFEDFDLHDSNSNVEILNQLQDIPASGNANTFSSVPRSNAEKYFFAGEALLLRDNWQKSIESFESAANMGYPPAYVVLAGLSNNYLLVNDMDSRLWVEKLLLRPKWLNKINSSLQWFKDQIGHGDPIANYYFGIICMYGYGVPKDEKLAARFIEEAALKEYPRALFSKMNSLPEGDEHRYFIRCLKLAVAGNSDAQYYVSCYYFDARDRDEMLRWLFKSAEQGNLMALMKIAFFYECGTFCMKNPTKALQLYEKAGELSCLAAIKRLGAIYYNGELGVQSDYKKAVEYYRKALELNNHPSFVDLARCYKSGRGVTQCDLKAAKLFRLALLSGYKGVEGDLMRQIEVLSSNCNTELYEKNIPNLSDLAQICGWTNFKIYKLTSDLEKNVMLLSEFIVKGVFVTFDAALEADYLSKLSISDRAKFLTLKEIIRFIDPNKNRLVDKYSIEDSVFAELFLKLSQGKNASETLKMLLNIFSSCKEGRDSISRGLVFDRLRSKTFTTSEGNSVDIYEYISLLNDEAVFEQHQQSCYSMK